ncbi:MAG TPA: transporter substrate-binding domain-containing protein [Novosphingobium sp.]|nr:transporter substrate-binding domain-containing protein [Novosphingobium sp.]
MTVAPGLSRLAPFSRAFFSRALPLRAILGVWLLVGLLYVARPVVQPPFAPRRAQGAGGVADLSRQAQLVPHFAMEPRIHAMLPADIRAKGRMSVAMSVGIAPVNFPGDTPEEVRGFTPDLAAALAQILGIRFEPTIYPSTASQLLALEAGRVSLAISTNSDTPERQRSYDFIDYLVAQNSLVMQSHDSGRLRDVTQLCGQPFGEVKGAVSLLPEFEALCRSRHLPAPILSSFDDAPSMMLALASRRILCFVGSPFNTVYLRSQGVAVSEALLPEAGRKLLGLTVSRRDPDITRAVMAAMQVLVANGYYRRALDRWGLGPYAMEPGVNLEGPRRDAA